MADNLGLWQNEILALRDTQETAQPAQALDSTTLLVNEIRRVRNLDTAGVNQSTNEQLAGDWDGVRNDLKAVSPLKLVEVWEMDEVSGNRAGAVGGLTLTDNATVASGTGILTTAADFETGNSEFLSRASEAAVKTGDIDYTWTAWINLESVAADNMVVAKDVDTPSGSREYVLDVGTGGQARFYINGSAGGGIATWGSLLSTATWYLLAGGHVAGSDTVWVSVDAGTPVEATYDDAFTVPQDADAQFRIGARAYSGFEGYFDGLIDQVGFWKRRLTSAELTALYNGGAGRVYPFAA